MPDSYQEKIHWTQYQHTVRHIWFNGKFADASYFMDDFGTAVECSYQGYHSYCVTVEI